MLNVISMIAQHQQSQQHIRINLVCPMLEYASSVRDPHLLKHINLIDHVQRRAARCVLHNYSHYSSVTSMQQEINWVTLQLRQQQNRLALVYKTMQSMVALQVPPYFNAVHDPSFIYPSGRKISYMYSYFPKIIILFHRTLF